MPSRSHAAITRLRKEVSVLRGRVAAGSGGTPAWDARGDLQVGLGLGTAALLPIGLDGEVLTVQSTDMLGVGWAPGGGAGPVDAGAVTYTPGQAGDWQDGFDPGNVDGALDQLAARPVGGSGAGLPAGAMLAYGGVSAPSGWLLCDGADCLSADYPDLFAVIGVGYGSSGPGHFSLPDLQLRFPKGKGGALGLGATGGNATVQIGDHPVQSHTGGAVQGAAAMAHAGGAVNPHSGAGVSAHTGGAVDAHSGAGVSAHAGGAVANHPATATSQASAGATQRGTNASTLTLLVHTHNTPILTHAVTQPNDHAVTQPANHVVTQPANHVVTQPGDHLFTQPSDHAAHGHGFTQPDDHSVLGHGAPDNEPPWLCVSWIIKT